MNRKAAGVLLAGVASFVSLLLASSSASAQSSNPAMSEPDRFMWEVFSEINAPAGDGSNNVVWETWALPIDLFGNPNVEPEWPSQEAPRAKVLETLRQQELLRAHVASSTQTALEDTPEFAGPGSEVRINRPLFDFVVAQKLWYVEGQEQAFARGNPIDSSTESKEVKAVWRQISESERNRYHWQPYAEGTYGLIALHIITKDIPAWTWATWEHIDSPDLCVTNTCSDRFGRTPDGEASEALKEMLQAAGLGNHWLNYRLVGTQMNYTDSIGRDIVVGNSVIESGFTRQSSCMTCHARASIGPRIPGLLANRLSVFPPETGTPDPDWFIGPGSSQAPKYLQLDFVWTFTRARRRSSP